MGAALTAPQGYNYQLNYVTNGGEDLSYPQVQLLQQLISQQEQSVEQQRTVTISEPQALVQSQNIAQVAGSQFENHLIQQISYGQQQQQVQQAQGVSKVSQGQTQGFSQLIQQQIPQPQVQQQIQSLQPAQQEAPQPEPLPQVQAQPQPQPQFLPQSEPEPAPQTQPQSQFFPTSLKLPVQPAHYQHVSSLPRASEPTYYNKEFYYLSAPQENYEPPQDFDDQLSKLKKNLRIVFIKAPEQNGLEKAVLQLVKDSQQPRTAIYVLTKQHNAAELAEKLQQLPASVQQKPEVVFIKYRTRQEAEHAQRTIQSQYESLSGPNHFNFEGLVTTHNAIGSTAAIEPRQRPAEESAIANAATPSPLDYLPPAE